MKALSVICFGVLFASAAGATSFLTAQKFPSTFKDLSFTDRMEVLAEGYEPFESEYDASGRCISGCAYQGLTLDEEFERSRKNTAAAVQNLQSLGHTIAGATDATGTVAYPVMTPPIPQPITFPTASGTAQPTTAPGLTIPPVKPPQTPGATSGSQTAIATPTPSKPPRCTPHNPAIPANQTEPVGEPLLGRPRISSPYGVRTHPVTGERDKMHWGIDFAAPTGTTIFSPAAGVVERVWTGQNNGKSLKIKHSNGYSTTYYHLSGYLVKEGEKVMAGCPIAKVGSTGRVTGAHLHYMVEYNGEIIDPSPLVGRSK